MNFPSFEKRLPPVSTKELGDMHREIMQLAATNGYYEVNLGTFAPDTSTDPLFYRYNLDPQTVTSALFKAETGLQIDPENCYLFYATPRALDPSQLEAPYSSAGLVVNGAMLDGNVTFEFEYALSREEFQQCNTRGDVLREYSRGGTPIGVDVLEYGDDFVAFESGVRPIVPDDMMSIKKILASLGQS